MIFTWQRHLVAYRFLCVRAYMYLPACVRERVYVCVLGVLQNLLLFSLTGELL